ncbi:MAG: SRPBCC family protein [Fimbriimonadaceae bacterium]
MPTVESTIWINAPIDKVYEISKDNESFPEFMKDVKSLVVTERDGNRIVSEYVGLVPQFMLKVRWTQEDIWDDANYTCDFKQIKGDYDRLDGKWSFVPENGGTRFDSSLDYEYNVPTLGPLVKKVIHAIVVKNVDGILEAIKGRSEA